MTKPKFDAIKAGYRSGLEQLVTYELNRRGVQFEYEERKIPYRQKAHRHTCNTCGASSDIYSLHTYTPDFYLPEYNFYIESKGRFLGSDRKKHTAIKASTDKLDIRFVFQRDSYLTAKKCQTYTQWCETKGYKYFVMIPAAPTKNRELQLLPNDWFNEEHYL